MKFVTTCAILRLGGKLVVNICFIHIYSLIDLLSIFNILSLHYRILICWQFLIFKTSQ
jgi:hypothetical protein